MKKLMLSVLCLMFALSAAIALVGCKVEGDSSSSGGSGSGSGDGGHTHSFTVQTAEQAYIASAATCTQAATYYYSCSCGEKGEVTFVYGSALGHEFGDWRVITPATAESEGLQSRTCSRCSEKEEQAIPKITHVHSYSNTVVEPTCMEDGYTLHSCACGDTYKDDYTSALNHSFTDYVSDNNATCEQDGTKTAKCGCCGASDTIADVGSKKAHSFNSQQTTKEYLKSAATCTAPATHYYSCSGCGEKGEETFAYGNPLGHDLVQHGGKPASCLEDSFAAYVTCTRCDYTTLKLIPAGHEPGDWVLTKEAACGVAGEEELRCKLCNNVLKTRAIEQLSHDFVVKSQKAATCTEDGEIVYECSNCHATKTQVVIAGGHMFGDDNVCDICDYTKVDHDHVYSSKVVAPTCTDMGYTVYTCSCGLSYKADYIDQKGHFWNDGSIKSAAGCTKDGAIEYACKRAGCAETYEVAIPASHDWNEDIITSATCTEDGEVLRTCKKCNVKIREVIAAEHKWGNPVVVTSATCTQEGLKRVTCEVCGATEDRAFVLGHEYKDGVCVRCGAKFIDEVTSHPDHLTYGMFFVIDDIVSCYGPATVNEYGVMLYVNADAQLDKVAVYLTQDGYTWRRTIACTGTNIKFAVFVPYLSYNDQIYYSGLNSGWINTFSLTEGYDGIWRYSEYATIGANLEDKNGNLLLSLYDIGQAGSKTRIFDDLSAMKAWLKESAVHKHKVVIDAAVEPTCTEVGYTEGSHCSICGEVIVAQNEIEALGHDVVKHPAKPATCTEIGWDEYETCTRCDYTTYKEIPALGHNVVKHEAKVATCTEGGWAAYETCTRCDYTTYIALVKLPHTPGEWKVIQEPTCIGNGEQILECINCGVVLEEREIPAFGHDFVDGVCIRCGKDNWNPTRGLKYTLNSDKTSYSCAGIGTAMATDIVIAKEYNGLPVTSIGSSAFKNCSGRTSITIGNSVTSIGNYAFSGCSGLTSITIPDSVTFIGQYAFDGCYWLEKIYITDIESWCKISGLSSLMGCGSSNKKLYINNELVTDLIIPDSVTSIGDYAFNGCSGLTSITIPDSVTFIGQYAFKGCAGLTSITIPDSVTSIGYYAFSGCSGLTSVTIGNSVTSIGYYAFGGCSGLTSVTIGNSVTSIADSVFSGCSGLTSVTIGNSVTSIGSYAFYNCSGLTSINIPDSVTSISNYTFYNCSGLTSVTIGNSVTSIGDNAFYICYKLVEVINNSKLYISVRSSDYGYIASYALNVKKGGSSDVVYKDGYLFYTYNDVNYLLGYSGTETELTLPQNYNGQKYEIYKYAFYKCSGLTSITIPDSVTSIGNSAFFYCSGLTRVTIPDNLTSIGGGAFSGCIGLVRNEYDNALYLGNESNHYVVLIEAKSKNITSCTINKNCKIIVSSAFYNCSGLTSITIPDSITFIGDSAFSGCSGLTSIAIPDSVTFIGDSAFYSCSRLTSVTIGNSVTSICEKTFSGCGRLTSVTIGDSITYIDSRAFYNCSGLTSIEFKGTIAQWKAIFKFYDWNYKVPSSCKVKCTDGEVNI